MDTPYQTCNRLLYIYILQFDAKRVMENGSYAGGDFAIDYIKVTQCVVPATPAPTIRE